MCPSTSDLESSSRKGTESATETSLFFRAWLRSPLSIASLVPSSAATGRAFARVIDHSREGDILELGSGTGAISHSLLKAGIAPQRLILVERDPDLATYLKRQFPHLRILQADAAHIGPMLDELGVGKLAVVVSSLPIVWFPLHTQAAIVESCFAHLDAGGEFLQMTNQPASPMPLKKLGLSGERAATIWRNFPPSFIWRYWRA
jgi:phosphatidylethanolamine/phosphatidyl-N-methylethanolamine N-methyltransferase